MKHSDKLSIPKIFVDTGISSRKYENFQNFIFRDLDLKSDKEPISFYRSDFRGVTIIKFRFWKNNFERCDFINAYISDTTFEECHFGTDFTNIIFDRVIFKANFQDTCAFYNCLFLNCQFEKENITQTVIRNCEYTQCIIKDCTFDKNAFDDITFTKSSFQNITLADMGALNFSFDVCTFENVILDPDYSGSYLIKNSSMIGIRYEYRGHEIPLSGNFIEDYMTLSMFYLEEKRYYEAFNSTILYHHTSGTYDSLIPFFRQILDKINSDIHFIRRLEQLERCVAIIKFYGISGIIPALDSYYMIGMLRELELSGFRFKDKIAFEQVLQDLDAMLQNSFLQPWIWESINPFSLVMAEVQIDDSDLDLFKMGFNEYLKQLLKDMNKPYNSNAFQIIGIRNGSLIVQFVSYAIAIFGLAKIIKSTISEIYSIKLEFEIQKQVIKLISEGKTDDTAVFQKNIQTARKIINEPSDDLLKKSDKLSSLFKRFNIYANTLSNGRHRLVGVKK